MFSYLHQPKGFYKRLFLLALPVIVQNLITTSLGFLDTFMVGLLSSDQMSAVTVANVPVFIIQLVVFGLQSGSSVLISQYWGRGDRESINRVMGIGFLIAGGVSVLFAVILFLFPAQVLSLVTTMQRLSRWASRTCASWAFPTSSILSRPSTSGCSAALKIPASA